MSQHCGLEQVLTPLSTHIAHVNRSGTLLLSGSDDHRLVITDPFTYRLFCHIVEMFMCPSTPRVKDAIETTHRANIFSAHFLPETSDLQVVFT